MVLTQQSSLTFKYLALPFGLGGRGGVQRFFLLSQNIPFKEELVPMDVWAATEKNRIVSSGENPSGTLPIISSKTNDDTVSMLPQHIATSRYLARLHEVTSGDDYKDYLQDLVADEYQGFRDEWVKTASSGTDDEKKTYSETNLPKILTKFDALYGKFKTEETYLSVSKKTGQPLWGDAAMYGLLRDNIVSGLLKKDDLKKYSNLSDLYESFGDIPAVKEWVEKKAKELESGKN